jgi:hypothetical protein
VTGPDPAGLAPAGASSATASARRGFLYTLLRPVSAGCRWFPLVPAGSRWFPLVFAGSASFCRFPLIVAGSRRSPPGSVGLSAGLGRLSGLPAGSPDPRTTVIKVAASIAEDRRGRPRTAGAPWCRYSSTKVPPLRGPRCGSPAAGAALRERRCAGVARGELPAGVACARVARPNGAEEARLPPEPKPPTIVRDHDHFLDHGDWRRRPAFPLNPSP